MANETSFGEYLIQFLKAIGVKRVYGIIGTSVVDFVDSLYEYKDQVRYVSVRHEQVAVAMADAEYRTTGNLAAALVHAGPGFLNSLVNLAVAYKDRVPLFLISGGVKRRLHGTDSWLEVDQQTIAKPITKATARITNPDDASRILSHLVKQAFSPPRGPILLEVPEDLWTKRGEYGPLPNGLGELVPKPVKPARAELREILGELTRSQKPLIYASGECLGPEITSILHELAERLGAYIVTSGNARGACDEHHPRCLGRVGFGGGSLPADKALEKADLILVLGDEMDDIATYAYTLYPEGDLIVVSENPIVEKRPIYISRLLKASPYHTATMLLREMREADARKVNDEWDREIARYKMEWSVMLEEAISRKYNGYVNPSLFFKELSDKLKPHDIITGGQGTHIVYAYDFIKVSRPGTFLAATNLGAMGYAFPAALGAKIANPDSQVLAVVGDGEFMMTIQDLETAVRENIPVKVIVVNDDSYRVLYLRQTIQKGGRVYGTLHTNPSFEALAKVFGAEGRTLTSDSDIKDVIREMLESEKPYVLELRISREDLPPLNLEGSLKMSGA